MKEQLHRVEPGTGGITRKGAGRGFSYVSANGRRITSDKLLKRIADLAVPPAWQHVWIASDPRAHIQATGVDAAGRTQYIYHPRWRELRDDEKFIRSLAFAQRLPSMRRIVTRDLQQHSDAKRRTLAAAVRLIDRAGLRVGGAAYAEENGSFGATTLQRRHVHIQDGEIRLVFRGKSAGAWDVHLSDTLLGDYFSSVPANPRQGPALCYIVKNGRRKICQSVSDSDVNSYLGTVVGSGFTAKDFRTWQGTTVATISLARSYRLGASSPDAVTAAIQDASVWLHDTPTIAKDSYVNPRVVALFEQGKVAALNRQRDSAVLELLTSGTRAHRKSASQGSVTT
ncbi:DNA topoisomerase IB [Arthrobacter sp. PAMC 25486]|uniref:DNA topoisomerase IB n=1 Tax=Arthrobacter sp. PAMC 25486 TaxID=1494608 RepID=UPI00068CDA99|nr:DNA topoisomerase IB [Arthrobacter sp. PAMC 25486]